MVSNLLTKKDKKMGNWTYYVIIVLVALLLITQLKENPINTVDTDSYQQKIDSINLLYTDIQLTLILDSLIIDSLTKVGKRKDYSYYKLKQKYNETIHAIDTANSIELINIWTTISADSSRN